MLARAVGRDAVDGGVRLRFPADAATAADLGRLAALEVACCEWLRFTLHVSAQGVTLDVRAPAEGMDAVMALFG